MNGERRLVRVFLSHTSDLAAFPRDRSFVRAALDAVSRAGMVPVDMGYFPAREDTPARYCRQRVRDCEIFVAVVGFRYGSMVPGETVSFPEVEFDEATVAGIPRLVFLLDETADVPAQMADGDRGAVDGFRRRLLAAGLIVRTFASAAALELEVFHALTEVVDPRRPPGPRELPPDVAVFTGRTAELAVLSDLLAPAGRTSVVISALSGTAGVGKTALALHWAHRFADRFPDGQLYVDLRGYDPDQSMPAADALAMLLRTLGVDGADIPAGTAERAARYRGLVAGRRMLVLLDNASSVEQVRPLLPGSPTVLAIVTSRDSLAGLVARHGARRLELGLLPLPDAVTLLRALIGVRVDVEPDAAVVLAEQCARLPLALRVAAELAVSRPDMRLADLVGELADQQRRLDLLDADGDPRTAIRAVFSWSGRHLPVAAATVFRMVGLHPGPDLDGHAAAALTDAAPADTTKALEVLVRAHLMHSPDPGRYAMHDLLWAYAAGLAADHHSDTDRRAALTRLFDYYLAAAAAAMDTLVPAERHRRPPVQPADSPLPTMTDGGTALAWLDRERRTLASVASHCARHGWPGHAVSMAAILYRYLDNGGHATDALALHGHACRAARHSGDAAAEARSLINLGSVCWRVGRPQEATDHLRRALATFREIGDRTGEARALDHLGLLYWRLGSYDDATDHLRQGLALFREIGDRGGEAYAVDHLGLVARRQGRYGPAADHFQDALALFREVGNRSGEAYAFTHIGMVSWRQGSYDKATDHLRQALALFREIGDRGGEAYALDDLGSVCWRQGYYRPAADHLQRALTIFREINDRGGEVGALNGLGVVGWRQGHHGPATEYLRHALTLARDIEDRYGEARALNGLGETLRSTGQPDQAHARHAAALAVAEQIGDRYEQARAHAGIGHCHDIVGEHGRALDRWRRALAIYTDLRVPDADELPVDRSGSGYRPVTVGRLMGR